MREIRASLPFIVGLAATRGMLGTGVGLLLSEKIRRKDRRQVATMFIAIGAVTTIPFVIGLVRKARRSGPAERLANVPQSGADVRSEGMMAY